MTTSSTSSSSPASSSSTSSSSSSSTSEAGDSIDSLVRAVAAAPAMAPSSSAAETEAHVKAALAGRYSIEKVLGEGGMGVVYLAREVELDRNVALKVVRPQFASDPQFRARLLAEAKTAAKLSHPNVVPVHRIDDVDGVLVLAMAYVDGPSLRAHLVEHGRLPARRALAVVRDVARALAHAHAHGIVHRDVKPDNILVDKKTGRVVVADFGIAAARGAEGTAGTRAYMSPEQEAGGAVDAVSDVYSLGVTAWELVTGARPSLPLREPLSGVPASIGDFVAHMIAPDPSRRPQLASDVVDAFTMALEGPPIPPELRSWANGTRSLDFGFVALVAPLAAVAVIYPQHIGLPALALVYSAARHAYRLQRLLESGHELSDLNAALDARHDEMRLESERAPQEIRRTEALNRFAIGSAFVAMAAFVAAVLLAVADEPGLVPDVLLFVAGLAFFAAITAVAGRGLLTSSSSTPWQERALLSLRRRFWRSSAARLFARLATKKKPEPPIETRLAVATTLLVSRAAVERAHVLSAVSALEKRAADARRAGDRDALVDAVQRLERIKLAIEAEDARTLTTLVGG